MNKWVYVGVAIVAVVILGAVAFTYEGSPATTSLYTSVPAGVSSISSNATTTAANASMQTTAVTTTGSSTTINTTKPSICADYPGYICIAVTCTPANSVFACSNATYLYSPATNMTDLYLNFSQNTGQEWSSFGVGYAPLGTKYNGGVPEIAWYTANYSSKSNVGTSLASNQSAFVKADDSESGDAFGPTADGSVWACFVNSGLVYVGSGGCLPNGGGSAVATYVEIGTVSET
jgi:hypothetical protein